MRKRIDDVALRALYELLLADGICATKADRAPHQGIIRGWVSKVMKRGTLV